jgi:hypothetical protein
MGVAVALSGECAHGKITELPDFSTNTALVKPKNPVAYDGEINNRAGYGVRLHCLLSAGHQLGA